MGGAPEGGPAGGAGIEGLTRKKGEAFGRGGGGRAEARRGQWAGRREALWAETEGMTRMKGEASGRDLGEGGPEGGGSGLWAGPEGMGWLGRHGPVGRRGLGAWPGREAGLERGA